MGENTEALPDSSPQQADAEPSLEGFEEAMAGLGNPVDVGQSEPARAVETSEAEDTPPEESADKADKAPEAPDEVEPAAEQTVNFDGFSDDQKTTFERLLKDGHVTQEWVEAERLRTLFQSNYTKKTMALAEERKALAEQKEDLDLLERIRADDRLHAAWLKLSRGDIPAEEESFDGDELVDKKTAQQVAREEYERLEAEKSQRTASEQAVYNAKTKALTDAAADLVSTLGVTADRMSEYLAIEQGLLPPGIDPILHITPEELQRRVLMRHEVESAKAEAAALREQLTKKTSRDERTSKQSLPPARRVSADHTMSVLEQTEADLGLDPDWSNVQGFGHRAPQR